MNAGNIDRTNDAIKASIKQNQEWIKRVMEANGLVAAGPVRIITTDYGAEKYAFDVAQPVRKGSAAPKTDAAAEGEAAPAAAPAPVASAGELKVTIPSGAPVEYVRSEPRKLAFASYTGYMAELDNQRNALRAWAVTAGHEVVDRPFESYKSGVDGAFEGDGKFDIYWAVKQ